LSAVTGWVDALKAQLKFEELRLSQMTQPQERGSGRMFDVGQRQTQVDHLKAQVEGAQWNLDKTVVRAPASGLAVTPISVQSSPFVVRVRLDDANSPGVCRPAAPVTPRSSPTASRLRT
jgi:multidrug resistance efflux pump